MGHSLCIKCGKKVFIDNRCRGCFKAEYEERIVKQLKGIPTNTIKISNPVSPYVEIILHILDPSIIATDGTPVILATIETINDVQFHEKIVADGRSNTVFFSMGTEEHVKAYAQLLDLKYEQEKKQKCFEQFLRTIYEKQPQTIHALHHALNRLD